MASSEWCPARPSSFTKRSMSASICGFLATFDCSSELRAPFAAFSSSFSVSSPPRKTPPYRPYRLYI